MAPYTFHIDLYDLAFIGTFFTGLTIAAFLWFTKRANRAANRFLALALVSIVLWIARILGIDIGVSTYFINWSWLPLQFSLALGPLIFFYVLKMTRPEYKFRWTDMLHFSPLLLELGVLVLEVKESIRTGAATYDTLTFKQLNPILHLLEFISVSSYLYLSHRLIDRFYRRLKFIGGDRYRYELRWLHRLLTGLNLLWLLWIPYAAVDYFYYHGRMDIQTYYPLYLLLAIIFIRIAVVSFLRPDVGVSVEAAPVFKPIPPAELKQKGIWLKSMMKTGSYHQDPELSLGSLAEKLDLSPHELSRIINTVLKKSFNDFINEFRIAEVARKMQDPAYDRLTLLGIALDSGFNSKTTFTRAFRRITGRTPGEYSNDLKKEGSSYNLNPRFRSAAVISCHETAPGWSYRKLTRNFMFRNYLKTAWRTILKNKGYAAINIAGLSIGICSCIVIYLITSFELSYDTFHPDKERIYRLVASEQDGHGGTGYIGGMVDPLPAALHSELTGFESVAAFHNYYAGVVVPNGAGEPKRFDAAKRGEQASPIIITGPQYFDIFKYRWLQGKPNSALTEPFKVVLSENEARRYFGNTPLENIIGKVLFYKDLYKNDSLRVTVSGIVKDWDKNTDFGFKDFISHASIKSSFLKDIIRLDRWGNWNPNGQAFVKLAKGANAAQLEKQFPAFVSGHVRADPGHQTRLSLQPLADFHFNSNYHDSYSRRADLPVLYGLMAIAGFILIIAAINFINLSTAQSLHRAKEVGVRKVLGSSRASLSAQFLIETLMITLPAVIVSALFANPVISLFRNSIPEGVSFSVFNPSVWFFLLLITVITTLLAGFYPSRILASYQPALSLKGQASAGSSQTGYLRKGLIVFQFTVSMVFIVCTVVVVNQMHFILNKDLGFDKDAVVTYHTHYNSPAGRLNVFAGTIKAIPGVEAVSINMDAPGAKDHAHTYLGMADIKVPASYEVGDANYVPLFGLKIVAGRNIMPSDTIHEFLINETMVRALGFKNPAAAIGKTVSTGMNDKKGFIVGVLKDFNATSLHETVAPFFFTSDHQNEYAVSIKISGHHAINNFTAAVEKINAAWKEVYPDEKSDYSFFDQTIASLYATEQKTSELMNAAMAVAILISCMGLFGLATFTARQRIKEIGIRKVLGATAGSITVLLAKDFLRLVIIAIVVASPLAYYFMHHWLQGFAYRVNISIWMFLFAGFSAMTLAVITVSFQSIKAALMNPVKSLKTE